MPCASLEVLPWPGELDGRKVLMKDSRFASAALSGLWDIKQEAEKMTEAAKGDIAFALSGLGGSNAHGAGFLAAAQDLAGGKGNRPAFFPGLKMITCTSGTI